MKPWKRAAREAKEAAEKTLQWGHGDEAVEEVIGETGGCTLTTLQWGHGDEAVEEQQIVGWEEWCRFASMGPRR